MATLEKLRNKAGVLLMIVIGLAMISFILGDLLNPQQSIFNINRNEIAKINGTSVSIEEYQQMVNMQEENYMRNTNQRSLDPATRDLLSDRAWNYLVQQKVMEAQYEELGIDVSGEELFDLISGDNPHPVIQRIFRDENGVFNKAIVLPQLKNMFQSDDPQAMAQWKPIEDQIFETRKADKYAVLIQKGVYTTTLDAEKALEQKQKSFNLSFIMKRYNEIPDSLVNVSTGDLNAYYKAHKESFKQDETRDIEYLVFNVEPTEADQQNTLAEIKDIKREFSGIKEVEQYVNLNSDPDARFDNTFYTADKLDKEIQANLLNAPKGSVYGPILENGVYKISKIADTEYLPDSVHARHILIQPQAQAQVAAARYLADSLLEAVKNGADFSALAQQNSADQASLADNGDLGWFKWGQMVPAFNDSCFFGNEGDIKIVVSQYGFHIIEILDQSKKIQKMQVGTIARKITPSDETRDIYYQKAGKFSASNKNIDQFRTAAKELGMVPRFAPGLKEMDKSIAGLESPRQMIKWAHNEAETGDVSTVFELGEDYVVAALTKTAAEGYATLEEVKTQISMEVSRKKKAEYIANEWKDEVSGASSIQEIAQATGTQVKSATGLTFNSRYLAGAGAEPSVIAAASVIEEGVIPAPVKGTSGVFVIQTSGVTEAAVSESAIAREKMAQSSAMSSRAYNETFTALNNSADIDDKRAKFY